MVGGNEVVVDVRCKSQKNLDGTVQMDVLMEDRSCGKMGG